jgi:hypothetical protein
MRTVADNRICAYCVIMTGNPSLEPLLQTAFLSRKLVLKECLKLPLTISNQITYTCTAEEFHALQVGQRTGMRYDQVHAKYKLA